MKHGLLAILLFFTSFPAQAQKNNFFGDIGMSSSGYIPGMSFTYNRKLAKHFGVGVGMQGYEFAASHGPVEVSRQFIPAVYADARVYLPVRRSLIFLFGDLGMNIYRNRGYRYERPHSNGVYNGVGVGYHYRVTKSGLGPYVSVKLANDIYIAKEDYPNRQSRSFVLNGDLVLSLGLKF